MVSVVVKSVKTLGLLGTGVIGAGWAARALHFGIDVVAADVNPKMEHGCATRSQTPSRRSRG